MLTLEELRADVKTGTVDTVIAAFTDMQSRLMGKRLDAEFFLHELEGGHGTEGCNYLLALEMEMDPVPGYELASWERGYGDFELVPDLATLKRIPELEFYLLQETYEQAHRQHYRDLTPSVPYILDYHILASTYSEPLLRQIRN